MTYELAKQLKDAGFRHDWKWVSVPDVTGVGDNVETLSSFPTLSELIEACGEDFGFLGTERNSIVGAKISSFGAKNHQGNIFTFGSTPEEAVAKLWLALNKH